MPCRRPGRPGRASCTRPSFIAIGPTGSAPVNEERRHPGDSYRNAYERTKAEADALALQAGAAGQDVVVLYPGVIYGPGEMTEGNIVVRMIADHLQGRMPGIIGPGDRLWSYAFVEDVAAGHLAALERGRAGERYFLCGENVTMNGLFERVETLAGAPPPRRHIPYAVAGALGLVLYGWAELTGHPPLLTHEVVDVFRAHWAYDSAKAQASWSSATRSRRSPRGCHRTRRVLDARGRPCLIPCPPPGPRGSPRASSCASSSTSRWGSFALLLRDLTWPQAALMAAGSPSSSTGRCCRDSVGGASGVTPSTGPAIRSASSSIRSRCWRSSWCCATTSGWRPRSGACWPGATAWPRSWDRRRRAAPALEPAQGMGRASSRSSCSARWPRHSLIGLDAAPAARCPGSRPGSWASPCPSASAVRLVESLPTTLDDNLTVPLAGALRAAALRRWRNRPSCSTPACPMRVAQGLVVNGLFAAPRLLGAIDRRAPAPCRPC